MTNEIIRNKIIDYCTEKIPNIEKEIEKFKEIKSKDKNTDNYLEHNLRILEGLKPFFERVKTLAEKGTPSEEIHTIILDYEKNSPHSCTLRGLISKVPDLLQQKIEQIYLTASNNDFLRSLATPGESYWFNEFCDDFKQDNPVKTEIFNRLVTRFKEKYNSLCENFVRYKQKPAVVYAGTGSGVFVTEDSVIFSALVKLGEAQGKTYTKSYNEVKIGLNEIKKEVIKKYISLEELIPF